VLLKLERTGEGVGTGKVGLEAGWVERDGTEGTELLQVSVPKESVFDNSGIRKAVALARYGEEMRDWIGTVRSRGGGMENRDDWRGSDKSGKWEQESVPLMLPDEHKDRLKETKTYLEGEMRVLGDDNIEQEVDIVERILGVS